MLAEVERDRRRARGRPGPGLGRRLGPAVPPIDALALGLQTLLRLAERRPVVAVAGNHDSPELFEALAPLLRPRGVFTWSATSSGPTRARCRPRRARRPRGRRVLPVPAGGPGRRLHAGRRRVVPRLRRARRRDRRPLQRGAGRARRRRRRCRSSMAHFLVSGVKVDRAGAARRARAAHGRRVRGHAQAIPAGPAVRGDGPHPRAADACRARRCRPSTRGRCWRSTSARPARQKRVVIVDVEPGRLAVAETRAARRAGGRSSA